MIFNIGDLVSVNDQDITGKVLRVSHNEIVIKDFDSEYKSPDDELVFRPYELTLIPDDDEVIDQDWCYSFTLKG